MSTRRMNPSLQFISTGPTSWMRAAVAAVDQAAAALCRAHWQPVPVRIARPVSVPRRPG